MDDKKDYSPTKIAIANSCSFTRTDTGTTTMRDDTGIYTITCTITNYDYFGDNPIQEHLLDQRVIRRYQKQYPEFHNAIYGSKFRQAKHSSKQAHTALKQNTRRIRNNGMIKHRIQNYNKPVTM